MGKRKHKNRSRKTDRRQADQEPQPQDSDGFSGLREILGNPSDTIFNKVIENLPKTPKRTEPQTKTKTPEEEEQERTAYTKKALRYVKKTDTGERIEQLKKLLKSKKYRESDTLRQKEQAVNFWLNGTTKKDKREADQKINEILADEIFLKWAKQEHQRYTTFKVLNHDTKRGLIFLSNLADVGLNHRSYYLPNTLYAKIKKGKALVKEVVEALHREKRNSEISHYFLNWLGFSQRQIEYYIKKYGREKAEIQDGKTNAISGIAAYYSVRPRRAGESDKPIIRNLHRTRIFFNIIGGNRRKPEHRLKRYDTYAEMDKISV